MNAAVSAGGNTAALLGFANSGNLRQMKPQVLIWEYPVNYPFPDTVFFRQLIPAVKGACTQTDALAKHETKLSRTTNILEVNTGVISKSGKDFVYLEVSDLALVNFKLTLTYMDGKSENLTIKRSTRTKNNGQFFIELSQQNLKSVSLSADGKTSGSVNARLCKG